MIDFSHVRLAFKILQLQYSVYKSLAKQIITQVRISQESTGTFTWLFVEANLKR